MPLEAGKLNRRIELHRPVTTKDTNGAVIRGWEKVREVWCFPKSQTGSAYGRKETRLAGAQVSSSSISFRIRYCEDIGHDWRVVRNGKAYDILQVLPDEAEREYVDLACGTGANSG